MNNLGYYGSSTSKLLHDSKSKACASMVPLGFSYASLAHVNDAWYHIILVIFFICLFFTVMYVADSITEAKKDAEPEI